MENERKEDLIRQQKIALLLVLWRFPEFITSFIAAIASGSTVVWLEFIENASVLIPGIILIILARKLNRNLKYMFNYGTGKVEAITALCIEIFDVAGLFCIVFFAIKALIKPAAEEHNLRFALAISILGLFIDLLILSKQKKVSENSPSKMFHTAYVSAQKEFFFDAASIVTLVVTIIFEKSSWIHYFSPVVCLIIVVPFFLIVIQHMKASLEELIDRTLDEESQLKIIKVLNEFYDSYEEFGVIRSRISGEEKYIDIELGFNGELEYKKVREISEKIRERIQEELGHSKVNLIVK